MSKDTVGLSATKEELRQLLGEPDEVSTDRKDGQSVIWKYGAVEYCFGDDGRVNLLYTEGSEGNGRTVAN